MDTEPFFTIITASFNNGSTIGKTLESVKSQVYQDLEHIVIDGGSCDETLNILKEYESTYALSRLSEPDDGIADALNKGLERARGRYILVLQADDVLLSPETLAKVRPLLLGENFDIYAFPVRMDCPGSGELTLRPIRLLLWNRFKNIFLHQGSFVHRRLYERIGKYNTEFSIAMDYDFFYRALRNGCTLQFGERPVALMAGTGVGSSNEFLIQRLREERLVQKRNEQNTCWRLAQLLFRVLYFPYKTRLLPCFKKLPAC